MDIKNMLFQRDVATSHSSIENICLILENSNKISILTISILPEAFYDDFVSRRKKTYLFHVKRNLRIVWLEPIAKPETPIKHQTELNVRSDKFIAFSLSSRPDRRFPRFFIHFEYVEREKRGG